MTKSTRTLRFTPFYIYEHAIGAFWNALLTKLGNTALSVSLAEYRENIDNITRYMLEGRFIQPKPSREPRDPLRLKGDVKKEHMSVDLLAYLGKLPEPKEKQVPVNINDVLKFYKMLEVFILKRQWICSLDDLELGQFLNNAKVIVSILPKLFLVANKLPLIKKRSFLNYIFSSVSIYRQFKVKSTPEVDSIVGPYTGGSLNALLESSFSKSQIGEWLDTLEIKPEDANTLRISIFSGNSSSPNAGASATRIIEDAAAVKKDHKLKTAIMGFAKEIPKSEHFIYLAEVLFENIWDMNNTIHSKLFHFTAKGGKARIVANVDWMTQTVLSCFHFYIFKLLNRIPSDFTFNHKGGIDYVYENSSEEHNFYSLDLSAATDKMPRILQARILCCLAEKLGLNGDNIAKHWLNIIDREYSTKNSKINNGKSVIYTVGQGMGIFTSWPIMALTHHYIVNHICRISSNDYALVGDDLVFRGKREKYQAYCNTLKLIGMEINQNKTIQSESKNNHSIEFARTFIINNIRINPIEFGALYAWNDEKTSFESFLYLMRNSLDPSIIKYLAKSFMLEFNTSALLNIAYFFWKYKVLEMNERVANIYILLSPLSLPNWFHLVDFARVHSSTALIAQQVADAEPTENYNPESTSQHFMHNFKSDLIVRTKLDAARARDLAQRMIYLRFIDDHIGYMALQISRRLFSAELINYDLDEFGNPLVSKRARRLLGDITKYYTSRTGPSHVVWGNLSYLHLSNKPSK